MQKAYRRRIPHSRFPSRSRVRDLTPAADKWELQKLREWIAAGRINKDGYLMLDPRAESVRDVVRRARGATAKRCEILVPAGAYRQAGRCQVRRQIERVKMGSKWVTVCAIHRPMISRGKRLPSV